MLSFQLHHALAHDSSSDCGDLCKLWHTRIAHLHHPSLRILTEIVTSVPEFNTEHSEVCKGCALGKYVKTTFPSSDSRSTCALDLIHSDLCGSMSTTSLNGYEYYVTFIDDFSRKTWNYFLKSKEKEVLQKFKEVNALVENHTGRRIKVLL